jgi:hypothetical protein
MPLNTFAYLSILCSQIFFLRRFGGLRRSRPLASEYQGFYQEAGQVVLERPLDACNMSLQQLPTELVLAVGENLDTKELASLVRTARRYHYILTTALYESAVTLTPAQDDDPEKSYYFPKRGGRKIVDFAWTKGDGPVDWRTEPALEYFKSKDCSLFTAWDSEGATGFHHLAAKGASAVLDILRQKGANIDAVMAGEYTPLAWMFHKMVATNWGNYKPLIQWFLDHGTNVLVQNEHGQTLLVEAAKTAPPCVVSSIIKKIKAANGNVCYSWCCPSNLPLSNSLN